MVKIHETKCVKCLKCVNECRWNAILFKEKYGIVVEDDLCSECGHCFAVCPNEAISMNGKIFYPDSELAKVIASRRSCRKYTNEPVSDEELNKIVHIASIVPSAVNQKSVEMVVIRDKDMLDSLRKITKNALLANFAILDNPLMTIPAKIMLGKQFRKIKRTKQAMVPVLKSGEKDILLFNAPCFIAVHMNKKAHMPDEDSHYAAYNMILQAEQMGLGTCFMGFAKRAINTKQGKTLLGIPENHEIYTCFVLGHPETKYLRIPPAKDFKIKYFG